MGKHLLIAGIIFFGIGIGGFILLRLSGESFIREVTQEVTLPSARPEAIDSIGELAPAGELTDFDGQKIEITDLPVKNPLVLVFWTTWHPYAADTLRALDEYGARAAELSVALISVNSQEEARTVRAFLDRGGYKTHALLDEDGAVGEKYGIRALPAAYFIDGSGVVRAVKIGPLDRTALEEGIEEILRERT